MMRELLQSVTVYLVTGYSDLRQGIDGLATRVQGTLYLDPYSRSLFLFCGRRQGTALGRRRIPALVQEAGQRRVSLAENRNGGKDADRTGGSLVAGGAGAGATGSDQARKTRGIVLIFGTCLAPVCPAFA